MLTFLSFRFFQLLESKSVLHMHSNLHVLCASHVNMCVFSMFHWHTFLCVHPVFRLRAFVFMHFVFRLRAFGSTFAVINLRICAFGFKIICFRPWKFPFSFRGINKNDVNLAVAITVQPFSTVNKATLSWIMIHLISLFGYNWLILVCVWCQYYYHHTFLNVFFKHYFLLFHYVCKVLIK